MEERVSDSLGNDVLGEYFEQHLCRKNSGQFFTPWHICQFMAACTAGNAIQSDTPLRVLDPSCGSGRMLLAGSRSFGRQHEFYGIDVDHTCVKMAALNLFLNGVFHSEVMWADALMLDDFHLAYRISLLPFGIFRIENKERSQLWHMYRNSFPVKEKPVKPEIVLPSQSGDMQQGKVSQLHLF
jgi:type I restriction-modification system DNA methylase subunit